MRKLIVLAVFALSCLPVLADELAPFLYYEAWGGYAIARADGTDSHILGKGLTEESSQFDASWSPSGAWLAWRGFDRGGCGMSPDPVDSLYLAGIDGEYRLPFQRVVYEWSAVGDRLVLVGMDDSGISWQVRDPIEEIASGSLPEFEGATIWNFANAAWVGETAIVYYETHVVVIHPDFTINKITLPQAIFDVSPQGNALFLADGELVALNLLTHAERRIQTPATDIQEIRWSDSAGLISTDTGWFYISAAQFKPVPTNESMPWIDWQWVREGTAVAKSEEAWMVYDFASGDQRMLDIKMSRYISPFAALSADENWVAYIEDGPLLMDLVADETHRIGPVVRSVYGNPGGYVYWHASQNWLIAEEAGMAGCGTSYYTQVTNGMQRYEIPGCGNLPDCAHWLPEQVNPALYPLYEKPAQPVPVMVFHAGEWVTDLAWSGTVVQSQKSNYNSRAIAWDVTTEAEVTPLTLTPVEYTRDEFEAFGPEVRGESEHYIVGWYVYDKETKQPLFTEPEIYSSSGYYVHYITPDESLLISGGGADPLKIWSLPDGTLLYDDMRVTAAALSPDGQYVAVGLGWDVAIYELTTLIEFGEP